jgi:hypothetical protein
VPSTGVPTPPGPPAPSVITFIPPPAPTDALIHVAANYGDAWLETRSRVDLEGWRRSCAAPCDRLVRVDGLEMRVTAPRMTPSNAFLIEAGTGVARLRVSGGSSLTRDLGIIGLAAGLPVTFGGIALLGVGSLRDDPGERTAGIATLVVGAAAVLVALPLLVVGSTTVRNGDGRYIAKRLSLGTF